MPENINKILQALKALKGVRGVALIEKFGRIKGSVLPEWVDPDTIIAIVTLILKASQRATIDLKQGQFNNAIIEFTNGKILFSEIEGNILMIITYNKKDKS